MLNYEKKCQIKINKGKHSHQKFTLQLSFVKIVVCLSFFMCGQTSIFHVTQPS